MPSSTWHNIETFVEIIRELKPASFLDIGVGNGKWGFLVREYTDVLGRPLLALAVELHHRGHRDL